MEKYRPSNGTEGLMFYEEFCDKCHYDIMQDCPIIADSMGYDIEDDEYPTEWIYNEKGHPTCTKYVHKEDYGEPVIMPENQLNLF